MTRSCKMYCEKSKIFKRSFKRLNEEPEDLLLPISEMTVTWKNNEEKVQPIMELMDTPQDPNFQIPDRRVDFIYALYGEKAKQAISLPDKLNAKLRKLSESSVDRALRRAAKVQKQMSESCCPDDVLPLTTQEINGLRKELESMKTNVCRLIGSYNAQYHALAVAGFTNEFLKRWNILIDAADGKFLFGYGVINKDDVKISNADIVSSTLKRIQHCASVPKNLDCFKDVLFENVVSKSNNFCRACANFTRNDKIVWRRTVT